MTSALTLPFLTDADPELAGEGNLDPLGLASIADRLADEIAHDCAQATPLRMRSRLLGGNLTGKLRLMVLQSRQQCRIDVFVISGHTRPKGPTRHSSAGSIWSQRSAPAQSTW